MCENNAANSGNAVMPIPSKGFGPCVETVYGAPRTGEETVRPDGNQNRQRQAEMTCPLDKWSGSVQFETLQLGMDFPHPTAKVIGEMGTTDTGEIQELLNQIQERQPTIGHLGFTEDGDDLGHLFLSGLTPDTLRGTKVASPIEGTLHQGAATIVKGAAQMSLNVTEHGFVIIPLCDDCLGEEVASLYGAANGLVGTRVLVNPQGAVSPKEAPELGKPAGIDSITTSVEEIHDSIITLSSYKATGSKDIQDEVLAGVGTYTVPEGMTEDTFRKGFMGTVAGSNAYEDGNITVDATPDANGATHSKEGVIAAIGMEVKNETDRDIYFGGGADVISLTNEIAFAERKSGTTQVWCYRHQSDCTAPTS